MKKGLAIVLTGTFIMGMTTGAFAATPVPSTEAVKAPLTSTQMDYTSVVKAPALNYMQGTITKVATENGTTSLTVKAAGKDETMVFHLSDKTYVIDAATALPLDLTKRVNDTVAVYYGPAVTMSLPAQSTATAVMGNIAADMKAPLYAKVEAVEKMTNGDVKVTTDGGSCIVTLPAKMPISPYLTKNIVTLGDVKVGSELLLWYDVAAMSMPAQATSTKAVLLPAAPADATTPATPTTPATNATAKMIISTQAGVISLNGAELDLPEGNSIYTKDNGDVMVPVRLLAEKLGYEVIWNDGAIILKAEGAAQSATFTIGDLNYGKNKMLVKLTSAPEVVNGKTYVPSSFFAEALDIEVVVNRDHV